MTCGAQEITSWTRLQRPSGRLDASFLVPTDVGNHRLDQSVASVVLSEPSETCGASDRPKRPPATEKRCGTADRLKGQFTSKSKIWIFPLTCSTSCLVLEIAVEISAFSLI